MRAGVDHVRFGAEEDRRQHHPPVDHQAVDGAVVAEELPSPGRAQVGLAVDGDVVAELVEHCLQPDGLAQEAVDQHHPVRQLGSPLR